MVSENTVLIVGAGGSIPFGYPSGSELVEKLCRSLEQRADATDEARILGEFGFNQKQIHEFREQLFYSGLNSIDAFLEKRTGEFLDIGKAAIAASLVPRESAASIFEKGDWY